MTLHPALKNKKAVMFDVGGTLVHPDWSRLAELVELETGIHFTSAQMRSAFYATLQAIDAELKAGVNSRHERKPHWVFVDTCRLKTRSARQFVLVSPSPIKNVICGAKLIRKH